MSNKVVSINRDRCITKPLKEKVNNYLQIYLWDEIVDKVKIKDDEVLEIELSACPVGIKQRICLADNYDKNVETEQCIYMEDRVNAKVLVIYDEKNHREVMMLADEFQYAAE